MWQQEQISISIRMGEIALAERKFNGYRNRPNIFSANPTDVSALIDSLNEPLDSPRHILSALSAPNITPGVSITRKSIIYVYEQYKRMYVDVSGDYALYQSSQGKKSLSNLKRKIKKVDKSNIEEQTVRTFQYPSEVQEFIDIAKPISATSYQELLLGTVFRTDQQWVDELKTLAEQDRFRGYVLYAEDKPVAYNYCPIYGDGVMLYDLSGYIPEYQRYSPGTVLQARIIELGFSDRSVKIYDLCQGEGRHKKQFATGSIDCCSAYIFPNRPGYRFFVTLHYAADNCTGFVASVLDRFNLKDKIKGIIRHRHSLQTNSH
ncbi:hypothetical protein AB833_26295 [Chromatiales bacterium (ex Bugula neritina AB1)]|nr:hypothetical protein AB833_26295 [Chromatiales bacterium (ex Bugula neritina AB1)]